MYFVARPNYQGSLVASVAHPQSKKLLQELKVVHQKARGTTKQLEELKIRQTVSKANSPEAETPDITEWKSLHNKLQLLEHHLQIQKMQYMDRTLEKKIKR